MVHDTLIEATKRLLGALDGLHADDYVRSRIEEVRRCLSELPKVEVGSPFVPQDILDFAQNEDYEEISEEEAIDFLSKFGKYIDEIMTQRGWDAIADYFPQWLEERKTGTED